MADRAQGDVTPPTLLTAPELALLRRLRERGGTMPDHPILRLPEATGLMRRGLIEAVRPKAPYLPYVCLTSAGAAALDGAPARPDGEEDRADD